MRNYFDRNVLRLAWTLLLPALVVACTSSNPTDPDTLPPLVGWALPDTTGVGDNVFVFTEDTTTIQFNAGDDGGIISNVKVYMDGALVVTLTAAPYRTLLSLSSIRGNRSARLWASAADPTGKVGFTADTLTFVHDVMPDTATWTLLSPARNPSARDGFTWEPDLAANRALLFGGYSFSTFSSSSELWSYDLVTNQWDSLATSGVAPPSRTRHGAGLAGTVMMVYGGEFIEGVDDSVMEEYSLLDLGTLTWNSGLFSLALRPAMGMASATLGTDVYAYGGVSMPAGLAHDSLVRYSISSDTWQVLRPANQLPGDRALPFFAADFEDQQLFLYGGSAGRTDDPPAGTGNFRLDLSNLTWTSTAAPGPPGLVDGAIAYDSSSHRVLIWGGRDAAGSLPMETWEFTMGSYSWRMVPTVGGPPSGRTGHRLIYDPARHRVVMFGGRTAASWSSETWELVW